MPKHTPGPWTRDGEQITADGAAIAVVYGADDFPCVEDDKELRQLAEECHANGILIETAPDLYLACELLDGWIRQEKISVGLVVWAELQRALAKARTMEASDAAV